MVTHPLEHLIMEETAFSIADRRGDAVLRKLGQDMVAGNSGFILHKSIVTGDDSWIAYMPVPSTGWSLGVIFPQDELMVDVTKLNGVVLGLGVVGFLFLLAVIVMISGSITKPLRVLARTTKEIAVGNLDFERPDIRSGDEVGHLADSFVYMRDALKKYIKELTQATAARERMESELKIAQDIQMSILPKVFPAFPDRSEFDIYAMLEPAREVGGDLYDFFLIDEDHLCFIIGDVSGKGVPAALFMAVTKTLINVMAKEIKDPAKIIERVNKELCHGNDACMFVTLFCGILNLRTGVVEYVNAGHNPFILIRKEGETAYAEGEGSAILGVFEDALFKTEKLTLSSGDMIYMYTDGVTEAFNSERQQFSEERLQKEVASCGRMSARELTQTTLQKLKVFTDGAEQSDDITIVVLRYSPDGDSDIVEAWEDKVLVLKNNRTEIHKIETVLRKFAKEHDISEEVMLDVNLALEEIFVNIISYAYDDNDEHNITVTIAMENEQLIAKITDEGKPFNLLDRPSPDIEQPIEERPNSGMGVLLVKELMDNVEYTRINGKNLLKLHKNIK